MRDPAYLIVLGIALFFVLDHFLLNGAIGGAVIKALASGIHMITSLFGG